MPRGPLPEGLVPNGNSAEFTNASMPDALLREHALGLGHWGLLHVLEGEMTFVDMGSNQETRLSSGKTLPIPPQARHRVVVDGPVRFRIDFYVQPNSG